MRISQLLGVALQVIPIAGGSVAGIVSVGAEILEGLSAKDLTDYLLGFGSNLLQDEVSSMSDRVFKSAAAALSPEMLEKMNAEYKEKLEEAVACCDMSVAELRELFIERGNYGKQMIGQSSTESGAGASRVTTVTVVEEAEDEVQAHMLETGSSDNDADSTTKIADDRGGGVRLPSGGEGAAGKSGPSLWKNFELGREEVKELSQEQVASLWGAHIVRNDDTRQEDYEDVRDCLISVLREQDLYADLIVDDSAVSSEALVQYITDKMREKGIEVTMGMNGMMRRFLRRIQRED